ncbi:MAG: NAD(P)/FAD-dependent oxidoreductase [Ktedonobacteraceae bacterium]|nr:NAD(P)/FAD-dependent oxidoreductase [Ktedonobacteraceae bacterium]
MSSRENRALVFRQGERQVSKPAMESADIVIVGNGIAGLTAAVEARQLAPEKKIVIVTDQIHPTINTPALKQFAIAKLEREQLLAYPAGTEKANRIHVVTAHVEEIHARSKYVTLRGGYAFGYGSLLLATGSRAQGLPADLPGREFDGVITLHRLQDYLDLRRRIGEVREAVVIGGGVHAIETVMGLRYWGIRVHWLIRSSTFMRGTLDETASEMVLDHVRKSGIEIHTETEVIGIVGRVGSVVGVITNHRQMIPCQLVAVCTGTQPVTTLAERSTIPIQHKRGIIVDDKLRSSVRDIFAAGDAAALKNPQTGIYEPRAQWYAAVHQGRIAGAMLAGRADLARQPFGTRWHATHLGDLSMLSVGNPLSTDPRAVTLTDTSQGGYRRLTLLDDRLIGYLSLGTVQPDSLAIKRIIDEGHSIRDITKALLKGHFDARRYFSERRSRAVEKMLVTSRLPMLETAESALVTRRLPTQELTDFVATPQAPSVRPSSTDALPSSSRTTQASRQEETGERDETHQLPGAIPLLPDQFLLDTPAEQEGMAPDIFAEELDPFSGSLPELPELPAQVTDSTARSIAAPAPARPTGPAGQPAVPVPETSRTQTANRRRESEAEKRPTCGLRAYMR